MRTSTAEQNAREFHAEQLAKARAITAKADLERRQLTEREQTEVEAALAEARAAKARIESFSADADIRRQIQNLHTGSGPERGATAFPGGSLGQQFIDSDTFNWLRQHRGSLPTGAWTSVASELQAAMLTEDAASGGDLVVPHYRPGIIALPTRPLAVADLMAPGRTDSNAITYMKETTFTNAAAPTNEGGTKPESTLTFDAVTDPVQKIAHWVPVTEEMLEDVPALRSYLDARLKLGVQLTEDDQLLNGSGTAPAIRGILNRSGLAAAVARGSDTNADAVLKQIAAIHTATQIRPDGIIMHPSNWLAIQLAKDTEGQYDGSGPFATPQRPTLWGLPVALTSAIVLNTALVGAFRQSSQVFRKGGLRVETSNSHADFFVTNRIAIRAEERLALAVYRANTFGTVTGLT